MGFCQVSQLLWALGPVHTHAAHDLQLGGALGLPGVPTGRGTGHGGGHGPTLLAVVLCWTLDLTIVQAWLEEEASRIHFQRQISTNTSHLTEPLCLTKMINNSLGVFFLAFRLYFIF